MTQILQATVFKNNNTQAVRLPKVARFPEDTAKVEVSIVGNTRVLSPAGQSWQNWFEHGEQVSDDFMNEREQPEQERHF